MARDQDALGRAAQLPGSSRDQSQTARRIDSGSARRLRGIAIKRRADSYSAGSDGQRGRGMAHRAKRDVGKECRVLRMAGRRTHLQRRHRHTCSLALVKRVGVGGVSPSASPGRCSGNFPRVVTDRERVEVAIQLAIPGATPIATEEPPPISSAITTITTMLPRPIDVEVCAWYIAHHLRISRSGARDWVARMIVCGQLEVAVGGYCDLPGTPSRVPPVRRLCHASRVTWTARREGPGDVGTPLDTRQCEQGEGIMGLWEELSTRDAAG
jgi:hypothetical protein